MAGGERERGGGFGFHRDGLSSQGGPADELAAFKMRLMELLTRHPGDVRLWMQAARSLGGKSPGEKSKDLAQSMEAVLKSLGDQILPAD